MSHPLARAAAAGACLALALPLAATAAHADGAGPIPAAASPGTESIAVSGVDRAAVAALEPRAAAPAVLTDEISTAEDFDVVGVTWDAASAPAGVQVQVRVREHGTWSGWESLPVEDGGPDPGSAEARAASSVVATEPLATDGADGVQVRVDAPGGAVPQGVEVKLVDGGELTGGATGAASAPVAVRTSGLAAASEDASAGTEVAAPPVITRAQWGADESLSRRAGTNSTLKAMVVHHTASSNAYSSKTSAMAQLRGIYAYHTKTLGWADIGYNFVVDKFGNIYEGRRGSITQLTMGAHASGFNTGTMGVSALGNYEEASPSSAMVTAISKVVAWKLGAYGVDPQGTTTLVSAGGGTSRFSSGRSVELPTVLRHLDVGLTACPGVRMSAQMPAIRTKAASLIKAAASPPAPAPAPVRSMVGGVPLTGDWDGNGRAEPGW
ncbi:N-acetylmuramoyl-L-alanine amidase, partial [uncultured Pseudokineococcus sp.]|uniref:N-acetylmuramoyl-L-alanine amidase n=1 Tax=uncultured Pseudokineococcus sp. TaxID=1642928 RepID=UPI00260E54BE